MPQRCFAFGEEEIQGAQNFADRTSGWIQKRLLVRNGCATSPSLVSSSSLWRHLGSLHPQDAIRLSRLTKSP